MTWCIQVYIASYNPFYFFTQQFNSIKTLISFNDYGRTLTQAVSDVQSL
jgi:hypothetical protein